jgi:hypothetical protein
LVVSLVIVLVVSWPSLIQRIFCFLAKRPE